MPYAKIKWVKLHLDLFDDDRFLFQLNDAQQLLFIKMLVMAGKMLNRIPDNDRYICAKLNYPHQDALKCDIERLMQVFPKFRRDNGFYFFENFEKHHNQLRCVRKDSQGIAEGYPSSPSLSLIFNSYIDKWNKCMNTSISLTPGRTSKLKIRVTEKMFTDNYDQVLDKVKASAFLMGRKPSKGHEHWKADFDWLVANTENYVKVLEGKYSNEADDFKARYNL